MGPQDTAPDDNLPLSCGSEKNLKRCYRCGLEKPRASFPANRRHADGLLGKCRECQQLDQRRYRDTPETAARRREWQRQYALEHPEIAAARKASGRADVATKKWRNKNIDQVAATKVAWRASRPGYDAQWRAEHPESVRAAKWKYLQTSYGAARSREDRLQREYGINLELFAKLFAEQEGRCAICQIAAEQAPLGILCVDHDHVTGMLRGLLCKFCNYTLGHVKDNAATLRAAADYLDGAASVPLCR